MVLPRLVRQRRRLLHVEGVRRAAAEVLLLLAGPLETQCVVHHVVPSLEHHVVPSLEVEPLDIKILHHRSLDVKRLDMEVKVNPWTPRTRWTSAPWTSP